MFPGPNALSALPLMAGDGAKVGRHRRPPTSTDPGDKPPGDSGGTYSNASSHVPRVAALEYSVARFSKKLVCSTPLRMASSQGSGFLAVR